MQEPTELLGLKLELHVAVSHLTWVPGIELGFSGGKEIHALNH